MSSIREAVERDRITVKIQNQSFQNNQMKRSASRDSPLRTKRGRPGKPAVQLASHIQLTLVTLPSYCNYCIGRERESL